MTQCTNCFAEVTDTEKCIFCDVAGEYAQLLRRAGIRNPAAWMSAQLEQVALDLVMPRGTDIDRVWDWHGHLLVTEWKHQHSENWRRVSVGQFLPLQTLSRQHMALVVVHVRPISELVDDTATQSLWLSDVECLERGANDRDLFLPCSVDQFRAGFEEWKAKADECDRTHGCWNTGCQFARTPEAFSWRRAFGG